MPPTNTFTIPPFIRNIATTLVVSGIVTLSAWVYTVHTEYVTATDLQRSFTEIRLHQVGESLRRFHTIGIDNLTDSQKHDYRTLVTSEEILNAQKDELDGFTTK